MNFCYKKVSHKKFLFCVLILVISQNLLHAQESVFSSENTLKKSISIQKTGMIALGSWATLNIISGTVGFYKSSGSTQYFHQMNAAWNLVNLGIAGIGYRGALNTKTDLSHEASLDKMQSFEQLLLINAGLDLLYIGSGIWLWKNGINKNSSRKIGYGKSIILQGSFLLLFDTALYFIHNKHTRSLLEITGQLSFTGNGLLLSF